MITLFEANETKFDSNGVCVLDNVLFSKPSIIEELNGVFTLELQVAIADNNKFNLVQEQMIIVADDNFFRITERKKNFNYVYVFCKQVFWDLGDNLIEDIRPTGANGNSALDSILSNTQYAHGFIGVSDIANLATANYVRMSPVEAIMSGTTSSSASATSADSSNNAFLSLWGGEMQLEKFKISILARRGADRGITIAYGKDLTGLEEDLNENDTKTRVMPIGQDENSIPILLPEKYIDSQYVNNYYKPKIGTLDVSGAQISTDNGITLANVYTLLRQAVAKVYANGLDLPSYNYTVNFIDLSNTEEYKDYAVLEKVYLGDTVTIKHKRLNMDLKARVSKTTKEYNIAKQIWEYSEIELGDAKQSLTQQSNTEIAEVNATITTKTSELQKFVTYATNLITGNKGGFVIFHKNADGKPYEILIMDTEDISTATKVWRFNASGLGYSKNGYNGPYGLAITIDGSIVADFMTTGTLLADLIKAGMLKSVNGVTSINMETGVFNFGGKIIFDGTTLQIKGADFTTYDGTKKAVEIIKEKIGLYDWQGTFGKVGTIQSGRDPGPNGDYTGVASVDIVAETNAMIGFGTRIAGSDLFNYAIQISNNAYGDGEKIRIWKPIMVNGLDSFTGSIPYGNSGYLRVNNGLITSYTT